MRFKINKQSVICVLLIGSCFMGYAQSDLLGLENKQITLSAIKGQNSKIDTLVISNSTTKRSKLNVDLLGEHPSFFKILAKIPHNIKGGGIIKIPIQFQPDSTFVGLAEAKIQWKIGDDLVPHANLFGLSSQGLEGKNEPPLSWGVRSLGYTIDLGWETLANHIRPDLQGEELPASRFRKVNDKPVSLIPVARYSPKFSLPYGYYTSKNELPVLHEVGVLADSKTYPEHQTLFPKIGQGTISFMPTSEVFGIYTTSPSHVAYSEDSWNKKLYPKHAAHACRIYPTKNEEGVVLPNQFLVCFEEAFNGDYQDYVFIIKNVEVVPQETY